MQKHRFWSRATPLQRARNQVQNLYFGRERHLHKRARHHVQTPGFWSRATPLQKHFQAWVRNGTGQLKTEILVESDTSTKHFMRGSKPRFWSRTKPCMQRAVSRARVWNQGRKRLRLWSTRLDIEPELKSSGLKSTTRKTLVKDHAAKLLDFF